MHKQHCLTYGPNTEMTRWMNLINEVRGNQETPEQTWRPHVDIIEDEHDYRVVADLPGVSKDSIEITLEDGILLVKGERAQSERKESETWHLTERLHGQFSRRFNVRDSVNTESIHASYDNGVL
ncbi:MAG TPA: Hsp20/alpha crystallin family protein, partial [Bacteroidetes bacterium]|nr:Hsp20/alpha crystallin family protein [Bacteroidota bacterium]HEX05145.1 Hsp20/alpha crystallin family protein [Bacteroidota bacterium]